jgi:hypothetical protein
VVGIVRVVQSTNLCIFSLQDRHYPSCKSTRLAKQALTVTSVAMILLSQATHAGEVGFGPLTAYHYAPNGNDTSSYNLAGYPGSDGFNIADVSSQSALDALPSGVKGLVYLGYTNGADSSFISLVTPFVGDSKVFAFYIADEPDPSSVPAADLKAEADWIHTHDPGAPTFITEFNSSSTLTNPSYGYYPANTDIDYYGLDPYPVQIIYWSFPGSMNLAVIPAAVGAATSLGISISQIIPIYQAFGGGAYAQWIVPTAAQEWQILRTWQQYTPTPFFDYAYSWGAQEGDTALVNDVALQRVFAIHNAGHQAVPEPGTPALLGAGLGALGIARRRRKTS